MSPDIGHEAGETARTVVEALKSTPAVLALVIFNLLFMGVVAWTQYSNAERWQALLQATIQQCGPK